MISYHEAMMNIFCEWWFEPAVATVSFVLFISWYWYYERNVYQRSVTPKSSSVIHWDIKNGPSLQSFLSYWIGIYIWTRIVPPASQHIPVGIPQNLPDCVDLVLQVVLGVIYYDAIFFVLHWMMHEIPFLRRFHARHHDYQVIQRSSGADDLNANGTYPYGTAETKQRPATLPIMMECRQTLSHSLVDQTIQVLVNILVQRKLWMPRRSRGSGRITSMMMMTLVIKSRLARVLHNIVVIWMLVESHSAAPQPYIWRRYFTGCREHYWHHTHMLLLDSTTSNNDNHKWQPQSHNNNHNKRQRYQQFFGYLDELRFRWLDRRLDFQNSIDVRSS